MGYFWLWRANRNRNDGVAGRSLSGQVAKGSGKSSPCHGYQGFQRLQFRSRFPAMAGSFQAVAGDLEAMAGSLQVMAENLKARANRLANPAGAAKPGVPTPPSWRRQGKKWRVICVCCNS